MLPPTVSLAVYSAVFFFLHSERSCLLFPAFRDVIDHVTSGSASGEPEVLPPGFFCLTYVEFCVSFLDFLFIFLFIFLFFFSFSLS